MLFASFTQRVGPAYEKGWASIRGAMAPSIEPPFTFMICSLTHEEGPGALRQHMSFTVCDNRASGLPGCAVEIGGIVI
jgi:hypothetical protein